MTAKTLAEEIPEAVIKGISAEEEQKRLDAALAAEEGGQKGPLPAGGAPAEQNPPPGGPAAAPPPPAGGPTVAPRTGAAAFDPEAVAASHKARPYESCEWPPKPGQKRGERVFNAKEVKILTKSFEDLKDEEKRLRKDLQTRHAKWVKRMVEVDQEQHEIALRTARAGEQAQAREQLLSTASGREPWEGLNAGLVFLHAGLSWLSPRLAAKVESFVLKPAEVERLATSTKALMLKYPRFGVLACLAALPELRVLADVSDVYGPRVKEAFKRPASQETIDAEAEVGPAKPDAPGAS